MSIFKTKKSGPVYWYSFDINGKRFFGSTRCQDRIEAQNFEDAKRASVTAPNAVNAALLAGETLVYVIGGPKSHHDVKIGFSNQPASRLARFQKHRVEKLSVLAQTPGGVTDERTLHRLFKADRLKGEWFKRSAEIKLFIELIGRRSLPIHLAVKWISDDRAGGGQ